MLRVLPTAAVLLLHSKQDLAIVPGRIRLHRRPPLRLLLLQASKRLLVNHRTSELLQILRTELKVGHPLVTLCLTGIVMDKAVRSSQPITQRITPMSVGILLNRMAFNCNRSRNRNSIHRNKSSGLPMASKALNRKSNSHHHSPSHHSSNHNKRYNKSHRSNKKSRPQQAHKEPAAVLVSTTSTSLLYSAKVTSAKSCWLRQRQRRSCMLSRC